MMFRIISFLYYLKYKRTRIAAQAQLNARTQKYTFYIS